MTTENIELLVPEGMSACGDKKGLIDLQIWFKGGIFLKIIKSRGDENVLKFEDPEDALSETIKKYEKDIIKYINSKQLPIGIEIIKEGKLIPCEIENPNKEVIEFTDDEFNLPKIKENNIKIIKKIHQGIFKVEYSKKEYCMKHISGRNSKWEFKREIESLMLLDHPNIVKIYGVIINEKEKVCAILLEYIEGKELNIEEKQIIETKTTWMSKLFETIEYIHSKGIFHGDIKHSNIIVTKNNSIKLIDFGGGITEKYNPTHNMTNKSDLIAYEILSEEISVLSKMINKNPD